MKLTLLTNIPWAFDIQPFPVTVFGTDARAKVNKVLISFKETARDSNYAACKGGSLQLARKNEMTGC